MKRLFALLVFFFCCSTALFGADPYEVRVRSGLNVRSEPGVLGPVVGSLQNRDTVFVQEMGEGWAKIEYGSGTAYVSAQFLLPVDGEFSAEDTWKELPRDKKAVLYAVLILSAVLWILYAVRKPMERAPVGLLWAGVILFWLLCGLEIHHVIRLSGGLWFCTPDVVGWGTAILNFILLGLVFYNQLRVFLMLLRDLQVQARKTVDYRMGIYSYIGAFIAAIIAGFFFPQYLTWVIYLWMTAQLVQIVIVIVRTWRSPVYCLTSLVTYGIGSVATLLVMMYFFVVALVVALVLLVLSIAGSGADESSRTKYVHY